MDSRTGRFISQDEYNNLPDEERKYFIETGEEARRRFQKEEALIQKQYEAKNVNTKKQLSRGSMRNKPCPCGSGKKYKKCCIHSTV